MALLAKAARVGVCFAVMQLLALSQLQLGVCCVRTCCVHLLRRVLSSNSQIGIKVALSEPLHIAHRVDLQSSRPDRNRRGYSSCCCYSQKSWW